jgi:hypothetical protein
MTRYAFDFSAAYRGPALLFGITPRTAWVELDERTLHVRYGPWSLTTPVTNIADVVRTGGFAFVKTAGPPHLSFSDRGISFATNDGRGSAGADEKRALCVSFHTPVPGIDPTGRIKHPGATLTVADPDALERRIRGLLPT